MLFCVWCIREKPSLVQHISLTGPKQFLGTYIIFSVSAVVSTKVSVNIYGVCFQSFSY